MITLTKKITNLLRILIWYGDFALFKAFNVFSRTKTIPQDVRRILVIELLYIGDVIVITPALRALKKKFPGAKIDVILRPSMKDVLSGNPNIDKILTYDKKDFDKDFDYIIKELENSYDLAVLFHPGIDIGNYKISKLLKKAKIPFRIGCTKVGFFEGKGFFMHRKTKPTFKLKHKIEDNLDVIRTIGIDTKDKNLDIYTTKESKQYINSLFKKEKITKKDFTVAIHASPQHKTHEWSIRKFANVADELVKKYKAKIIFTGTQKDEKYNDLIIEFMEEKAINLAGKTDIKQFFAAIKRANLVISVDTSAMHIAAAFEKPTIALFGAGNPKIWRPYCDNSIVIFKEKEVCTSCMKHKCRKDYKCMKVITEKDVLDAVKRLIIA